MDYTTEECHQLLPASHNDYSSIPEALSFKELPAPLIGSVDGLLLSVNQVYSIFEPWFHAKCSGDENKESRGLIRLIQEQGWNFAEAMQMSLETSSSGCILASEALEVCSSLAKGKPEDDIHKYLEGMLKIAEHSHRDAKNMADKFREVCRGIVEIQENIVPNTIESLEVKLNEVDSRQSRKKMIQWMVQYSGTALTQAGSIASFVPPLGIILPIVLPVVGFILQEIDSRCERSITKREKEQISLNDVLSRVKHLATQLEEAYTNVYKFVDWWSTLKTKLSSLQRRFLGLTTGVGLNFDKATLQALESDWNAVGLQYKKYTTGLLRIQDRYPFPSPVTVAMSTLGDKLSKLTNDAQCCVNGITRLEKSKILREKAYGELQFSINSIRQSLVKELELVIYSLRDTAENLTNHEQPSLLTHTRQNMVIGGQDAVLKSDTEKLTESINFSIRSMEVILASGTSRRKSFKERGTHRGTKTSGEPSPQPDVTSRKRGLIVLGEVGMASMRLSTFCMDFDLTVLSEKECTNSEVSKGELDRRSDSNLMRAAGSIRDAICALERSKDSLQVRLESNRMGVQFLN